MRARGPAPEPAKLFARERPGSGVKAIVRVDAAPGFEESTEAALAEAEGVFSVVRDKEDNFDLVAGLEAEDANGIQDIENAIRHESGVQGLRRVDSPSQALRDRLHPD